ncbi:Z1 domain-containing protein [Streptacidiphilus anmyonensis]|uniref:Z1 domain-containing protein n=1 Tax=Streptacidiphilus anmyonensis TaxID=405782 RepID=UPI0005AA062E|nr:Z1 domain-containing protein [Streptacidiphilus anmyonensis]
MGEQYDEMLYDTFKDLLDKHPPAEAIKRLEIFGTSPEVIGWIRERHEQERLRIRELEEPRSAVLGNRDTWYTGPRDGDKCWPALVRLLERDGWPMEPAIRSLDESSTRIVSLLNHPRESSYATRGLVVGYVQSGKTTSFTAVTAKAVDRGYKLIIVLAGIHNGLRRQTQARLMKQLVAPNPTLWSQMTDLEDDFRPQANPASYFGKNNRTHVLCVVKKNATVLRRLARWLDQAKEYLQDCPALIIDDEADQATVATRSINPLILQIMGSLPRSAYVGYTASPFANLLIDPSAEDLYPKDFIVNLPQPQGHFGTEVLFGRYALDGEDPEQVDDGYDMIRSIPKDDIDCVRPRSRDEVDGFEPYITDTLRESLYYFWLVTAARRIRGTGNPHNTMLIHTSVNTEVHNSFERPLRRLRDQTKVRIATPELLAELRGLWERETSRVSAEEFGEKKVAFDELLPELVGVLDSCRILMDNSSSDARLDYENGPVTAIAVGGNTLSRGLTLEGLSVSYFVRAVSAYDTLLQMGRWFGFRNGYADLPRIWMTDELAEWFRHLATVETEMRRDIDVYLTEDETPLSFAVRLRTHPNLRVTAAAKMKNAVMAASSFGGKRVQTHYFHTNRDWLVENQGAARALVQGARSQAVRVEERSGEGRYLFREVPHELVLAFLGSYRFHEESVECDAALISDYIRKRVQAAGALTRWNVAIVGKPLKAAEDAFEFAPGTAVGRVTRARLAPELGKSPRADFADIKTLMSRRDAAVDLAGDVAKLDETAIMKERERQFPDNGLLVLYPIDRISQPSEAKRKQRAPLDAEEHVIGVGLVFPKPSGADSEVRGYVSADLSNVVLEEEDWSALDEGDA